MGGKMYPMMLERKTGMPSEDTGTDGFKTLGLECKDLEGEGSEKIIPKAIQVVTLKQKSPCEAFAYESGQSGYKDMKGKWHPVCSMTDKRRPCHKYDEMDTWL